MVKTVARNDIKLLKEILAEMAEKKATSVAEDAMGDMGAAAPLDTDTTSMAATEAYESDINYALMVAVTYRSAQMVEMLLEAGAKATYFSSW